jgi:hypothetical protein
MLMLRVNGKRLKLKKVFSPLFDSDAADFFRFHDLVARRLGYFESTSGWANMIRDKSASDAEAFHQFYILLDEFRKDLA